LGLSRDLPKKRKKAGFLERKKRRVSYPLEYRKGVKMPLDGVNKLCVGCIEKCKQWKQITVIHCSSYKKSAKLEKVHLDQAQK